MKYIVKVIASIILGGCLGYGIAYYLRNDNLNSFHQEIDALFEDKDITGWIINEPVNSMEVVPSENYVSRTREMTEDEKSNDFLKGLYEKSQELPLIFDKTAKNTKYIYQFHNGGATVQIYVRGEFDDLTSKPDDYRIKRTIIRPIELFTNNKTENLRSLNESFLEYYSYSSDFEDLSKYRTQLGDNAIPKLEKIEQIGNRYYDYFKRDETDVKTQALTDPNGNLVVFESLTNKFVVSEKQGVFEEDLIISWIISSIIIFLLAIIFKKPITVPQAPAQDPSSQQQ